MRQKRVGNGQPGRTRPTTPPVRALAQRHVGLPGRTALTDPVTLERNWDDTPSKRPEVHPRCIDPSNLSTPIRKMIAGVSVLAVVCAAACVGHMLAGWSLGDAFYMVAITVFAVGGFIQLVVDGELNRALEARRMTKEIDQLEDHTIICGYGRMGTTLARELHAAGQPFVAIDTLGGASTLADDDRSLVISTVGHRWRTRRSGRSRCAALTDT